LIELAFSILASDFSKLGEEVATAASGGGTVVHVDVMDGHFVPNLTIGPPVVKSLRAATKLPLDCHLMIDNPEKFIPAFGDAGADWVSVQYEVCKDRLPDALELIAKHGMKPAVVINPDTPVEKIQHVLSGVHHVLVMSVFPGFGGQAFMPIALDKIRQLAAIREAQNLSFRIEVDGGVAHDTVASVVEAGADLLVAGSAIFAPGKTKQNAEDFLRTAKAAKGLDSLSI
jgi:ribulose-phosphate 3-epimerase